jgi:hypothetical protein
MGNIRTNRDLYLAIGQLIKQEDKSKRSLESYLLALLNLGKDLKQHDFLTPNEFAGLLEKAFYAEPLTFDELWRKLEYRSDLESFTAWQHTLILQVVDLREMDEKGTLKDEMRYFGIDSPRGSRWYNFDPHSFLECGMAGSFGGWGEGDDTGRAYVSGSVAVINELGEMISADPREVDDPVTVLEEITWQDFTQFLYMGQSYE